MIGTRTAKQHLKSIVIKEKYLRHLGYDVEAVSRCQWQNEFGSFTPILLVLKGFFDRISNNSTMTHVKILYSVRAQGSLYGFVKCDIKVPDNL